MGYDYLLDDRLAQGSAPPRDLGEIPFDTIVLAAMEYQPSFKDTAYEVLHVPLDDSGPPPTSSERMAIRKAAHDVAKRLRNGRRVLVTCWQGRNRSGVIAGLALVELGFKPHEVAQKIQRLRDGLTNPHFYRMVIGS